MELAAIKNAFPRIRDTAGRLCRIPTKLWHQAHLQEAKQLYLKCSSKYANMGRIDVDTLNASKRRKLNDISSDISSEGETRQDSEKHRQADSPCLPLPSWRTRRYR